ncbi:MAG: hypothetical protein ACOYD4_01455 [Solirubrobacterales bacterium]
MRISRLSSRRPRRSHAARASAPPAQTLAVAAQMALLFPSEMDILVMRELGYEETGSAGRRRSGPR